MQNNKLDHFIDTFFENFFRNDWQQCDSVLTALESQLELNPQYAFWSQYFYALLLQKRDNKPGLAEKQLLDLLQKPITLSFRIRVLRALGIVNTEMAHWSDSIGYLGQAVELVPLNEPVELARNLNELAIVYSKAFDNGDFGAEKLKDAVEVELKALMALDEITPNNPILFLRLQILNNLSIIYKSLKLYDSAIGCIKKVIKISQELNSPFDTGIAYGNLGEIYQAQGRNHWPKAKKAYKGALTLIHQPDNWRKEAVDIFANLGLLFMDMNQYEKALSYYTQAITGIEILRSGMYDGKARIGYFATVASIFDHAILLCLQTGNVSEAFALSERARARAFQDVLAREDADLLLQNDSKNLNLKEVQTQLQNNEVIIAYYTTGLLTHEAIQSQRTISADRHRFPLEKTLIFALTDDEIVAFDSKISPNLIQSQHFDASLLLEESMSQKIYKFLLEPVAEILEAKDVAYFVPHGSIHSIPFHALIASDGEPLLRENGPLILYSPTVSLLCQTPLKSQSSAKNSCLSLGYSGEGKQLLNQAEPSAKYIADLMKGTAVVGTVPKSEILFKRGYNFRYIHFACHGQFNASAPLQSALYLSPNEWLTAEDVITKLRLECDLVVLGACETGLSHVHRGDELEGLVRAFMLAGSQAVLTTNWQVHDHTTSILMAYFYEQLATGKGMALALKQAQLFLKTINLAQTRTIFNKLGIPFNETTTLSEEDTPFSDPIYWAPFTLMVRSRMRAYQEPQLKP